MSYLWICLSLVYAASFLPSSSSDEDVSVTCNSTVEVATEDHVTLICTLFILEKKNCGLEGYVWRNTTAHNLCEADPTMYKCDCDNMTYVSLTIFKPVEENYTVCIQAECGEHKSSVQVIKSRTGDVRPSPSPSPNPSPMPPVEWKIIPALVIVVLVVVGAILFHCCFRSNRDRKMMEFIKEEKTQEDKLMNTWKEDEKRQFA